MSTEPLTICVNCKHHNGPKLSNLWYDHKCSHPNLRREAEIDPVTGQSCYSHKNDLGRVGTSASPFPFCRDINNGNCPHYE